MIVQQFFLEGIAHSSYLLGGSDTCAIVDPRRDTQIYIDAAESMGIRITHILETHLHADFISGHLELADKTGAKIYAPRSAGCRFDHVGVGEGDSFMIEDMEVGVLETPGHTPEHVSYVIRDSARADDPVGVFCGDTLFVGDVGRPDLFPGMAEGLAAKLYHSLHDKLLMLSDYCEVYPAHGAGSLCGRAMAAKRTSTIGYERRHNAALQIKGIEEFIESLTSNMPPAPDHFSRCSAINRDGPSLIRDLPAPEELSPGVFRERANSGGAVVLDVRRYDAFGGQHIQGAYHIDIKGNFATFAGWVLPPCREVFLVTNTPSDQAEDAAVWLRRVGIDQVKGYLGGGMFAWAQEGFQTGHVGQVSSEDLYRMAAAGEGALVLCDVRSPSEFNRFHIEGAINIPVADMRTRYKELDPDAPTVVICSTGHRSSLGASILKQHGFKEVINAAGGMTGYGAAGYAPECPFCYVPHGPHFMGK